MHLVTYKTIFFRWSLSPYFCMCYSHIQSPFINKIIGAYKYFSFSIVVIVKLIIIRLPIFVRGNREFPIVEKRLEPRTLNFFKRITEILQNISGKLINIPLFASESYILCAEK